jgi:hypothetical protein
MPVLPKERGKKEKKRIRSQNESNATITTELSNTVYSFSLLVLFSRIRQELPWHQRTDDIVVCEA